MWAIPIVVQSLSHTSSFQPHGLQHTTLPCPSLSPGVCSNSSCPLSRWYPSNHLTLCLPFSLLPSTFPSIRVFSNELVLPIRWPKYWSFSISPSSEYSGLISFRIDWFDLLAGQGLSRVLFKTTIRKHQIGNDQGKGLWVAPSCSQVGQKFWVTWGPTCHLIPVCLCVCYVCVCGGARRTWLVGLSVDPVASDAISKQTELNRRTAS